MCLQLPSCAITLQGGYEAVGLLGMHSICADYVTKTSEWAIRIGKRYQNGV